MRIIKINENQITAVLTYIILILFITVCVCLLVNIDLNITYGNKCNDKSSTEEHMSLQMNPICKANKLREIMYIFHRLCDENKVYYIIGYETLLGAVTNSGNLTPNNNIHLIVKSIDRSNIYKILEIMRDDYGFKFINYDKISRIIVEDEKNCYIDIFFVMNVNDKIYRTFTKDYDKKQIIYKEEYLEKKPENEWWWKEYDYEVNLIEYRKKFVYDDLVLWGPEKADQLLKYWYGDNYLTSCKTSD